MGRFPKAVGGVQTKIVEVQNVLPLWSQDILLLPHALCGQDLSQESWNLYFTDFPDSSLLELDNVPMEEEEGKVLWLRQDFALKP